MENVSVSKGVFTYKGSYKIGKKKNKVQLQYLNEPWYTAYNETWQRIEQTMENVRTEMYQQVMSNLQSYVSKIKDTPLNSTSDEIPTAALLIGVNVPDHQVLFDMMVSKLSEITSYIAVVWSKNCQHVRNIVEDTVYQFIQPRSNRDLRKSECTLRVLKTWVAEEEDSEDPIVIILPDFESFSMNKLQDFILILSSYRSTLKFVLIFGIATTLHVVHNSLTYNVTSKLIVQVFHMQKQVKTLCDVLEAIVFSSDISFRLIGRAFQLLTDIFLFYDFSVDNFLQNYKKCMIQHFYDNNMSFLCCQPKDIKKRISILNDETIAEIKGLPSIARYLKTNSENPGNDKFKEVLESLLKAFHEYMYIFFIILKCLHCLVESLPNAPLGKQLREVYAKTVYTNNNLIETAEYKQCLTLLKFLSKEEFLAKLESVMKILDNCDQKSSPIIKKIKRNLDAHISIIGEASLNTAGSSSEVVSADEKLSRLQLKEKLLRMSQQRSQSAYKQAQINLIDHLDQNVFSVHLVAPSRVTGHEIFCYSDGNQAKHHICGSLRAAIHMGLSDPQIYLGCRCCRLANDDDIPRTLPDMSIIYKLHLESRKLINMYDWMQAFLTIVNPQAEPSDDVDPQLQARFTQAVAALQFLGFIKTSQRQRDHVKRLI